jgi:CO/xanthine dehydrogenase Mo-binding subunit
MDTVSRRNFLIAGAAASGTLLIGCRLGGKPAAAGADTAATSATADLFAPNAYVRVGKEGKVTVILSYVEMGQGTYTSMPMLIAEELDVPLSMVTVEHAPPSDKLYANPVFGLQATGGSTTIRAAWQPMREAGAAARAMLVAAAAQQWGVEASTLRTENGTVIDAGGRTLGYGELAEAASKLPVPTTVTLKDPRDFKLIGTPAKRLDSPAKVNGTAQFGIDVRLPGLKVATVAMSPVWGGKVVKVDSSKAKAVKGFRQVVQLDDAVAVVGDHMWAAKQGLAACVITWDEGANATASSEQNSAALDEASKQPGVTGKKEGDADAAIAGAARKLEAVYEVPFLAHATMEPMNCTVHVQKDRCEVWTGTQVLARTQATAAEVTGLPLEKVVVHNHLLGGGFGRRLEVDWVTQAVKIGKQVKGPVKVVWTRETDMQHGMYRPNYHHRLEAGLDRSGKVAGWKHRVSGPSILARWLPPAFTNGLDFDAMDGAADTPYDWPVMLVDYVHLESKVLPTCFWRSVGPYHNVFAREGFVDELAAAARVDPLEYRRRMLAKNPRGLAAVNLAAKHAGWGTSPGAGRARGIALLNNWNTFVCIVAEVEMPTAGDLKVRRLTCAVDCGSTVNPDTVVAQMQGGMVYGLSAALYGEIAVKDGKVVQSNFHDYQMVRMNESPVIEVYHIPNGEAPGGIGEPATATIAPALVNAVAALTGRRIRKLPILKALATPQA